VYSPAGVRAFKAMLTEERPDLVHLHNPFPLISPWVIRVAKHSGIPVVQTVHNYRHSCIAGTYFRDGGVCTLCEGRRVPVPGVVHGCYRDSRLQSVAMAAGAALHRGTWQHVDRFFALTPFMKERLVVSGLPADRIVLRPTSAADPGPTGPPGLDVLFVGRLDEAKGVGLLLDAWARRTVGSGALRIAGTGPLSGRVTDVARGRSDVVALGRLTPAQVSREMVAARAIVVPSLWFEGLPRVVTEAFAHARPIVTTDVGAVATVVDATTGWTHPPTADALAVTLDEVARARDVDAKSAAARAAYERHYTAERSLATLLDTYESLIVAR
jgi:glycosyltransferase involved in cell wall biosynthesis